MPLEVLRRRSVLDLLGKRDLGLYVAVTPDDLPRISRVVGAARDSGVWVGVWPMLGDAAGRWAGETNRGPFMRHASRVLAVLVADRAVPDGFALDLEPPVDRVRRVLRGRVTPLTGWPSRDRDSFGFATLLESVEALGVETVAAVVPPVLFDGRRRAWERVLGTPVPHEGKCRVCPMAYSSLIEGYGGGRLSRTDATSLVYLIAQAARGRYGPRACLAVGIVGRGAIGSEAPYRTVSELATDVAAARAAGVDDLVLHDLAGVLSRAPAERWLDAFVEAEPREVLPTRKARVIAKGARWFARIVG